MSSKQPFFSIVIPTKNRPEYLKQSIQSVLWQDFDNYELIISDNFNEAPTEKVLEEFKSHPKVRVFRTEEELNMIDHWEFATTKASGQYVILLADRKVLYNHSLKKLKKIITKNPDINVYSFGTTMYNEDEGVILDSVSFNEGFELLTSKCLIDNFLGENLFMGKSLDRKFPKTLNGCYRNDYAKSVRGKLGRYFNLEGVTTPDFSSFFINVGLNETIGHLSFPIILAQGEKISNGRLFGQGKVNSYIESLELDDLYLRVPIKAPYIYNLVFSDFLVVRELIEDCFKNIEIDWVNYYATIKYEYNRKDEVVGLASSDKQFFLDSWQLSFSNLEEKEQRDIIEKEQRFEEVRVARSMSKRSNGVKEFMIRGKAKLGTIVKSMIGPKKYSSALEAANFNEL